MGIPLALSIVFGAIGLFFSYRILRVLKDVSIIRSIDTRHQLPNNNKTAVIHAVNLTKEAEEKIEIFDDGDWFEESTYNDPTFVEAVREKLKENRGFRINCLFNCKEPRLAFAREFFGTSPSRTIHPQGRIATLG